MLGKIGIVHLPVVAVVLVPAFELLTLGSEVFRAQVGIARPDGGRGAGQHRRRNALGMMSCHDAYVHAAEREADQDRPAGIRGIHDGQDIANVVVQGVSGGLSRLIGAAVAARIEGDAAEALAEIGQLRLVDAGMHNAPWRQEHHGLRAVAVDLVADLDAIARGEPLLARQLGTHCITSPLTQLLQDE